VLDARDLAPDGALAPAMARVWAAYDGAHDEITTTLRARLADHPEFGPLVAATPRDLQEEARSHAVLRSAMTTGEWTPYWERVRTQAAGYANAQISFSSWVELIHVLRADLLARIAEAAGPDLVADVTALDRWLDDALAVFGQAFVSTNEAVIARQQQAIRQLSTPVLQLEPGLLLLPIVGVLDHARLTQLRGSLLDDIRGRRARAVVVDVTGVPEIDEVAAGELIAAVAGARMMGAGVIVSGLSAEIAQTLVQAGVDLEAMVSAGDLQSGIELARGLLR
jgi:anti-anti-sigma regulatory factor